MEFLTAGTTDDVDIMVFADVRMLSVGRRFVDGVYIVGVRGFFCAQVAICTSTDDGVSVGTRCSIQGILILKLMGLILILILAAIDCLAVDHIDDVLDILNRAGALLHDISGSGHLRYATEEAGRNGISVGVFFRNIPTARIVDIVVVNFSTNLAVSFRNSSIAQP